MPNAESQTPCAVGPATLNSRIRAKYADVFKGDARWQGVKATARLTYDWNSGSTYVQNPPYFRGMTKDPKPLTDIAGARILALLGDKITTDHISPAGSIKKDSPAGQYLLDNGVTPADFNQYGTRRGNHEVMMRGTFANIRIKNGLVPGGKEGGWTTYQPAGDVMPIYDAAMKYQAAGVPLVVIARRRSPFLPYASTERANTSSKPKSSLYLAA